MAFGLAPVFGLLQRVASLGPLKLAGAGAIGVASVGLVALFVGVVINQTSETSISTPTPDHAVTSPTAATGTVTPPSAPDGRTGDPTVDAVIDDFLSLDAAGLGARYGEARVQINTTTDDEFMTTGDWTRRLASARLRRLFAVTQQGSRHDIILEVITASGTLDGWTIMVQGDHIDDVFIRDSTAFGPEITQSNARSIVLSNPNIGLNYESYVVLPPAADLPKPPPVQDGATRTGIDGVDALMAVVEAKDAEGLEAAIASPDAFRVRQCDGLDSFEDAAYARDWATGFIGQVVGLESVANVPDGFSPAADHVLIFVRQSRPLPVAV